MAAQSPGNGFRVYAEFSGGPGEPGSIQSGLAIANASSAPTLVSLELIGLDGVPLGLLESIAIPARGQVSRFIHDFISEVPDGFRGTIRVTSESLVGVVAVRGRINERGDYLFMATPPLNAWSAASFFPHIAYGGGWTTQMVLFGQAGQASSGNILIRSQDGVQNTEFGEAPALSR